MSNNSLRLMMIVCVAFALTGCGNKDEAQTATAPSQVAADAYKGWKDYTFADGKFAVKYPANKADPKMSPEPTCTQTTFTVCKYLTNSTLLMFAFYADNPSLPKSEDEAQNGFTLNSRQDLKVNGIDVTDLIYTQSTDERLHIHKRVYVGNGMHVIISGSNRDEDVSLSKDDIDKFLNSFALVKAPILTTTIPASSQNDAASNKSFLQTLLDNKWSMTQGMPCTLNGGAYVVYDKEYGRYNVSQGKPEKMPKEMLIVNFTEPTPSTVGITIQSYSSPELEHILNEKNFIAGKQEYIIRKLDNGRIEESQTLTMIDLSASANGQKVYTTRAPQVSISDVCKIDQNSSNTPSTAIPVAQVTVASSITNLLEQASKCSDLEGCIGFMLQGADARKQEVMQMAAARIADFPKPEKGDRKAARELNKKALELLGRADYSGSINLLQQATGKDPKDVEILSNLGLAFVKAGKASDAEKALKGALLLEPKRTSSWTPLAETFDLEGKPDMAVSALLVGYEFSGNKDKTVTYFTDKSTTAERDSMKSSYSNALAKIKAQ